MEWVKRKEMEKICEQNETICEARATEKLLEEKRLKVISRGEECDYQRILSIGWAEIELEENLNREKKIMEQSQWNCELTKKLAEEVSRLKNNDKEIREEKQRHLLRATSLELRQLEGQLRNAYNVKSLQIQLNEREAIRANSRCRELQQDKAIKDSYQNDHFEHDNRVRAYEKREQYRHDLQKQLITNCQLKRNFKIKEFENDRKLREEIMQMLHGETRKNSIFLPSNGKHAGKEIAELFKNALAEHDLDEKVAGITVDNLI
ncbi:meiosis-specific nuclear structural protein 1-like [Leptopilina heterotoma]|uniref:meiosis-specific nuclear structural protein 1-like n=1 Tax=Leptopilina heterotoma TaxID=63436 RepID=UPI001CA7CC5A|nr:meiosis-specific nuclear structural protein 1-like [Leptopilina heterotoma]